MLQKNRNAPGIYFLKLFFVIILLASSYLADFMLMDRFEWIDAAWAIPITAAAIWLGWRETLAVSLVGLILSLSTGAESGSQIHLWTSAAVGIYGAVLAVATSQVRRSYAAANVVSEALSDSPLAYAELSFPGYHVLNYNAALLKLAGQGELLGQPLPAALPSHAGDKLADLLDRVVAEGKQKAASELRITDEDGQSRYWNISAMPVRRIGHRTPRSVTIFGSEVTDAVFRAANRDAALRISHAVMSNLDLEETLQVALDSLVYIAAADTGVLFLLEDDQWIGKAGAGACNNEQARTLRIPSDDMPAALEAVSRRRSVVMDDGFMFDGGFPGLEGIMSALIVPLITGNRTIGAVLCADAGEQLRFTDEQLEFSTVVGSQAALAIENASIYGNEYAMRKSLEAIESISEAGLTSLDIEEVLIELVTRTQDVMQMDAAMILLVDNSGGWLNVRAVTGSVAAAASGGSIRVGESLAGKAFSFGEPMKIDNLADQEPEMCPFAADSGIRSIMAVPLKLEGKTIGVLQIGSLREAAFAAREWGLIQVLADRASHAVQNSMLHEKTREELARAALLRDVASACASSRDIVRIAERALGAIYEQLGCEIASIYYYDRGDDSLVNLAFLGHTEAVTREFRTIPMERNTFLTQAVQRQEVITHDTHPTNEASPAELAILESLEATGDRRAALPIVYRGESIGGMALAMPGKNSFSALELDTFGSIADQLAVALQGSRVIDHSDV